MNEKNKKKRFVMKFLVAIVEGRDIKNLIYGI